MSAVADTKGAMDEEFQLAADSIADGFDLFEGKLSFQDKPGCPKTLVELCLFRCPDSALCRGMHLDVILSAAKNLKHRQILGDDSIDSRLSRFSKQPFCVRKLVIIKDGVECQEYPRSKEVGIFTKPSDILHGVACVLAGTERRSGDIHGIGTAVDCCDADVSVSCRSKKFEVRHYLLRAAIICFAWAPNLASFWIFL